MTKNIFLSCILDSDLIWLETTKISIANIKLYIALSFLEV